ncbi:MAG: lactoylglutathione lyase [Ponticaulis sp.]|nr:lactoylglutathione lyase [Ponticaulis sp.]
MRRMIFLNLPVTDLQRATAFYEALGFKRNDQMCSDDGSALTWSDAINIMLLKHEIFAQFTPKQIGDVRTTSTALISLSTDDREDVDKIAATAVELGGRADVGGIHEEDFMYARDFEDPDGNGFGILWIAPVVTDPAIAEP